MQGLWYLAALIGIGVLILWYIKNDQRKPGEPTTGFLRMERTSRGQEPKRDPLRRNRKQR